jgi:hypothetical protein
MDGVNRSLNTVMREMKSLLSEKNLSQLLAG